MAKCFFTGTEIILEEAFVLDRGAAYRALLDLRQRAAAVDRLIQQLSPIDEVEIHDPRKNAVVQHRNRRLVSPGLAAYLGAAYPAWNLFITFAEHLARKQKQQQGQYQTPAPAGENPDADPNAMDKGTATVAMAAMAENR